MKNHFDCVMLAIVAAVAGGCATKHTSPAADKRNRPEHHRAMMMMMAGLSGTVPSRAYRSGPPGQGGTGSIGCQFIGAKIATVWWVDNPTRPGAGSGEEWPVNSTPATSITGFDVGAHKIYFYTASGNTKPPTTSITVYGSKTTVLDVKY